MRRVVFLWFAIAGSSALAAGDGGTPGPTPGIFSEKSALQAPARALFDDPMSLAPVAKVEGEVITVRDLTDALMSIHEGEDDQATTGARDYKSVLNRLIDTRLVVLEARDMGIADLPEVKDELREYHDTALVDLVKYRATRKVKPDPKLVEEIYKDLVREWKIRSVLFPNEGEAQKLVEGLNAGRSFDELAKEALDQKRGSGGETGIWVTKDDILPQVMAVISKLEPGWVSPIFPLQGGAAVLRLEEIRYPKNPEKRAQAESQATEIQRHREVDRLTESLKKKYATIDRSLLKKIDFEAEKPGFAALEKDKRVLVRFPRAKPITVADLTAKVKSKFFHGIESPIKEKKVNEEKIPVFESLVATSVYLERARDDGLEGTVDFKRMIAKRERGLLFETFLEKAVKPGIKVTEGECTAEYEKNPATYNLPGFYKLAGLAFAKEANAKAAYDKLKAGTDLKWLKANADGQLKDDEVRIDLNGKTIAEKAMDPSLAKALAGAKDKDVRLYSRAPAEHYVLVVKERISPRLQPYKDVREKIAKELFGDKVTASVKEWTEKLRKAHKVEIYPIKTVN